MAREGAGPGAPPSVPGWWDPDLREVESGLVKTGLGQTGARRGDPHVPRCGQPREQPLALRQEEQRCPWLCAFQQNWGGRSDFGPLLFGIEQLFKIKVSLFSHYNVILNRK